MFENMIMFVGLVFVVYVVGVISNLIIWGV